MCNGWLTYKVRQMDFTSGAPPLYPQVFVLVDDGIINHIYVII
jgi:hypothetical protein